MSNFHKSVCHVEFCFSSCPLGRSLVVQVAPFLSVPRRAAPQVVAWRRAQTPGPRHPHPAPPAPPRVCPQPSREKCETARPRKVRPLTRSGKHQRAVAPPSSLVLVWCFRQRCRARVSGRLPECQQQPAISGIPMEKVTKYHISHVSPFLS